MTTLSDNVILTREYSSSNRADYDSFGGVVSEGFLENVFILDRSYITKAIIDEFKSCVWTERYDSAGDFELVVPASKDVASKIQINDYVSIKESDVIMIVETVELQSDAEAGDYLVYSGRSLESILARRIIWGVFKKNQEANFQEVVKEVLTKSFINPTNSKRKVPGFIFKMSKDPEITKLKLEIKTIGDNIYDWVQSNCADRKIGWRIKPVDGGGFEFELYRGTDRSRDQDKVASVIFSDSYGNLISSNYIQSELNYKTNALVRGDDDGITMEVQRHHTPERIGLDRREVYINTNLQPDDSASNIYNQTYYNQMLNQAKEVMADYTITKAFDSDIDWTKQFIFGRDYFIGDIVQVENRYGFEGRCRVSEIVKTRDASGPSMIPTFVVVEVGNDIMKGE